MAHHARGQRAEQHSGSRRVTGAQRRPAVGGALREAAVGAVTLVGVQEVQRDPGPGGVGGRLQLGVDAGGVPGVVAADHLVQQGKLRKVDGIYEAI